MSIQHKFENKKIALVLSGGATKAAAYHLGVAKALFEEGVNPDIYVGSSAGSIVATYLASKIDIDTLIDAYLDNKFRLFKKKTFPKISYPEMLGVKNVSQIQRFNFDKLNLTSFIDPIKFVKLLNPISSQTFSGLFNTRSLDSYFKNNVLASNDFSKLDKELYIVATELDRPHKAVFGPKILKTTEADTIYYDDVSPSQAVAASCSIPIIYEPFDVLHKKNNQNIKYVDGEIRDTLSIHIAKDASANIAFVSYTHQPCNYTRRSSSIVKFGPTSIFMQSLYHIFENKIKKQMAQIETNEQYDLLNEILEESNIATNQKELILSKFKNSVEMSKMQLIPIHPEPNDLKMFIGDHFSLSPKKLKFYVDTGYKNTKNSLNKY